MDKDKRDAYRKSRVTRDYTFTDELLDSYEKLERQQDQYKFLISYVEDLIAMWPQTTMRTLSKVTQKVADLKEALRLVK